MCSGLHSRTRTPRTLWWPGFVHGLRQKNADTKAPGWAAYIQPHGTPLSRVGDFSQGAPSWLTSACVAQPTERVSVPKLSPGGADLTRSCRRPRGWFLGRIFALGLGSDGKRATPKCRIETTAFSDQVSL